MRNRRAILLLAIGVVIGSVLGGGVVTALTGPERTALDSISVHAHQLADEIDALRNATTTSVPNSTTTAAPTTTVAPTTTSSTTTTTVPSGGVNPPNIPGPWALTFSDEFTAPTLDRAKWNTFGSWECCAGGRSNPSNGELDYKTDGQNFSFANGTLTIQARRETAPNGQAWTSGQLGSTKAFRYAYIETRAKFPTPAGFLDAFWTWQAPGGSYIETDVYEFYSDNHNQVDITQHNGGNGDCGWKQLGFDPTTGFHTYGADIESTGVDFYIDGVKRCHATGTAPGLWNIVDYMTVNASSRAPVADPSTTHAEKVVDYIRVWQH